MKNLQGQSAAKISLREKMNKRLIGKTFNKIKVLKFSRMINSRSFYEVECLRCGTITEMRSDRFNGTQKLETCSKCRQKYAIQKSKERATPDAVVISLYSQYKNSAVKRGLEFSLTLEQFKTLIFQECNYCGSDPIETTTSKSRNRTSMPVKHNGIDRIDNTKGYTMDNCVPSCLTCNMMKKQLTVDEFLEHIRLVHYYSNK